MLHFLIFEVAMYIFKSALARTYFGAKCAELETLNPSRRSANHAHGTLKGSFCLHSIFMIGHTASQGARVVQESFLNACVPMHV